MLIIYQPIQMGSHENSLILNDFTLIYENECDSLTTEKENQWPSILFRQTFISVL